MGLSGKQKIWFLINRLSEEREVTAAGKPIGLDPSNELGDNYSQHDLMELLDRLEQGNVAKLVHTPTDQTWGKYQIELMPGFDKYVEELNKDPEYLEWTGKKPKKNTYFGPENQVDFNKDKKWNKDKYISIGQVQELEEMPKAQQKRILSSSLTDEQVKEMEDSKVELAKLLEPTFPQLTSPNFTLPPNYQAEQVGLLKQLVEQKSSSNNKRSTKEIILQVTYTKSHQIILNDTFQLAQPQFNGENDLVFSYLIENPNKTYTKKQLEQELKIKITKHLHKIVENLGFKGDLAKVLFSTSKTSITFRNPVTQADLEQMGISKIRLK